MLVAGVIGQQIAGISHGGRALFGQAGDINVEYQAVAQSNGMDFLGDIFLLIGHIAVGFHGHFQFHAGYLIENGIAGEVVIIQGDGEHAGGGGGAVLAVHGHFGEIEDQHLIAVFQGGHLQAGIAAGAPVGIQALNLQFGLHAVHFIGDGVGEQLHPLFGGDIAAQAAQIDGDIELGALGDFRHADQAVGTGAVGGQIGGLFIGAVKDDVGVIIAFIQHGFVGIVFHQLIIVLNIFVFIQQEAGIQIEGSGHGAFGQIEGDEEGLLGVVGGGILGFGIVGRQADLGIGFGNDEEGVDIALLIDLPHVGVFRLGGHGKEHRQHQQHGKELFHGDILLHIYGKFPCNDTAALRRLSRRNCISAFFLNRKKGYTFFLAKNVYNENILSGKEECVCSPGKKRRNF